MLTGFFGSNRSFIEGFRIWKFALFAGLAFTIPYWIIANIRGRSSRRFWAASSAC